MSKILRVSENDYRIKVKDTGTITLDVGNSPGTVRITGDLVVDGDYTTINVTDMQVEDNIILLNKGEIGPGVTAGDGRSGIEIYRGPSDDRSRVVWDEDTSKFLLQSVDADGVQQGLLGIIVNDIATDSNATYLNFDMQNGPAVLHVSNSTGYEGRISDPNDIPNVQYLFDYVSAYGGSATVDKVFYPISSPGSPDTLIEALTSSIRFSVRQGGILTQRALISANGLDVNYVNIKDDTIQNSGANNLKLTALNNNVEIDGIVNIDDYGSTPSVTSGITKIVSRSTLTSLADTPGRTGLFFANSINTDELVSKNRALLFSILF